MIRYQGYVSFPIYFSKNYFSCDLFSLEVIIVVCVARVVGLLC